MISTWLCTLPDGRNSEELLVRHGDDDRANVLVIPPLFGEHNLMRRQLALIMRALAYAGIGSVLPDIPGTNESTESTRNQTLVFWRKAIVEATEQLAATHVFAVRSGALLLPGNTPGWLYSPQSGAKLLRQMFLAQTIADREAGLSETAEDMFARSQAHGITLAGWTLSAEMVQEIETAKVPACECVTEISQADVISAGLWLRSEPDENTEQAERIAAIIANNVPNAEQSSL